MATKWFSRPQDAAPVPGDAEDANSLSSSRVAETLNEDWETNHPGFPLAEAAQLRSVLFSKKTAVVSETYVLQQLQGVLELRNGWLRHRNLPLHFQMRDKREKAEFLSHARFQYEMQPHQQERQADDAQAGGNTKLRSGMRSRWAREQQRRCGSPALWGIVSFTGRFEVNSLESVGAPQPDDQDNTPHLGCPDSTEKSKTANQKRDFSGSVGRTKNKKRKCLHSERQLLQPFDNGDLLRQANDATRASGHGLEDEGEEPEPEDDAGERDATMHGVEWT